MKKAETNQEKKLTFEIKFFSETVAGIHLEKIEMYTFPLAVFYQYFCLQKQALHVQLTTLNLGF